MPVRVDYVNGPPRTPLIEAPEGFTLIAEWDEGGSPAKLYADSGRAKLMVLSDRRWQPAASVQFSRRSVGPITWCGPATGWTGSRRPAVERDIIMFLKREAAS